MHWYLPVVPSFPQERSGSPIRDEILRQACNPDNAQTVATPSFLEIRIKESHGGL